MPPWKSKKEKRKNKTKERNKHTQKKKAEGASSLEILKGSEIYVREKRAGYEQRVKGEMRADGPFSQLKRFSLKGEPGKGKVIVVILYGKFRKLAFSVVY